MTPSIWRAGDSAAKLISRAQVQSGTGVESVAFAEHGFELAAIEEPFPADPTAREFAGPREGLDTFGIEAEVRGGLFGAQ